MGLVTSSLRSVRESWHPNRNTARNDNMENDQTAPSMVDRLLHLASLNGHHQYARLLLYVGANVDATNQERWTPLHVSSFHGHALAVLLLDRGADVNATEGRGLIPLHLSSQNGHETVAHLRLDRGAVKYLNRRKLKDRRKTLKDSYLSAAWLKMEINWARYANTFTYRLLEFKLEGGTHKTKNKFLELQSESTHDPFDSKGLMVSDMVGGLILLFRFPFPTGSVAPVSENKQSLKNLNFPTSPSAIRSVWFRETMGLVTSSLRSVWQAWRPNQNAGRNDNMENDQDVPTNIFTPLHIAALYGNHEDARLLLDEGADVDEATNHQRWTPLHVSSFYGHQAVALVLLDRGADVSATDIGGYTPLHLSSQNGHDAVASLLLDRSADLSVTTEGGFTPLHLSAFYGHQAVALCLLNRGADLSVTTEYGDTPLHLSTGEGHRDVSQLLIEWGADVCATKCDGSSPLHNCSEEGHKEVVDLLLSSGAEIDSAGEAGFTAIHWACQEGHLDVVKALSDRQARTDTVAVGGRTPLHSACANGRWDIVRFLINRYGPGIVQHTTRQLQNDIRPLTCDALVKGAPVEILELLFDNGAAVHGSDDIRMSPLHDACIFGSFDTVRFIHSKGVAWDVVTANGLNPVHYAVKRRNADFQQKIKELLGTEMFNRLEQMEVTPWQNRLDSDFEDVAEIGSGSYGKVLKGRWKKNNEWYAIKRLEPRKQVKVESIQQEIKRLHSRAQSPFITHSHWDWSEKERSETGGGSKQQSEEDDDSIIFYIVMELCDSDLYHWMEANPCGKRDRGEVLQLISDIAAGLRFLHSYKGGLIHRDLAPRNILLKKGVVVGNDPPRTIAKFSDLGLASDKTSTATGEQFPLHSSGWNRPEPFPPPELPSIVTSTPLNYNESVDIYNAGIIFHQLLAFKRAQAIQPNKLTDEFRREQPQEISSFLDRMFAFNEKRPDAYEVERAAKKWLADYKQSQGSLTGVKKNQRKL
ncbi:unnamed protein product [Cyprideis torosa]|uniref:Uncharacterized protein n=1 Tax=Cyprideis torosa TaxID=163714 RepID=A0A7R8ZN26_9CRUS|nr:unnamed protein product [Cyprideis torosa]CAG0896958.1 unnamed protein product [Cyprideis torosa]